MLKKLFAALLSLSLLTLAMPAALHAQAADTKAKGELKGRIFMPDGSPAAGARFSILSKNQAVSGPEGFFSLILPPDSKRYLFVAVFKEGCASKAFEVERDEASYKDVEIRLEKGRAISGVAFGANGKPMQGIAVSGLCAARNSRTGREELCNVPPKATTAKEGTFTIAGLPEGEALLEFSSPGYERLFVKVPASESKVEARLVKEKMLLVKASNAATGAEIDGFLLRSKESFVYSEDGSAGSGYHEFAAKPTARFPFRRLLPSASIQEATYALTVLAPGYKTQERSVAYSKDSPEETVVEFKLEPGKPGEDFVNCKIKKPDGSSAGEASLIFFPSVEPGAKAPSPIKASSARDGAALVNFGGNGDGQLYVSSNDGYARLPKASLKEGMEIKLAPWSKISLRWAGALRPGGSVELRNMDFSSQSPAARTQARSIAKPGETATFDKLMAGPFALSIPLAKDASSFLGGSYAKWGVLKEGETLTLDLGKNFVEHEIKMQFPDDKLVESLKFSLNVSSPAPQDGVETLNSYALRDASDPRVKEYSEEGREDFSGRFSGAGNVFKFPAFQKSVKASLLLKIDESSSDWIQDFSFLASETKRSVDLRQSNKLLNYLDMASLAKDSAIDGVVRYPDGRPAEGLVLNGFYDEKWTLLGSYKAVTDKDGCFKVEGLPAVNKIICTLNPPPGYASERIVYDDIDTHKEVTLRRATILRGKIEVSGTVELPQKRVQVRTVWKGGSQTNSRDPGQYSIRLDNLKGSAEVKVTVEPLRNGPRDPNAKQEGTFDEKIVTITEGSEAALDFYLK